jgi:hypothetical protein
MAHIRVHHGVESEIKIRLSTKQNGQLNASAFFIIEGKKPTLAP